ncbi:MAG: SDR family oxidoreductase [Deltaproteobacteria bacterium]|nr:SDR family oxidoreductase [Deltaproteobacteria bacterium]
MDQEKVSVVVLGAGGMLGHVACLYFLKRGYSLVASARSQTGISAIDARLVTLDLTNTKELNDLLKRHPAAVVINCAAVKPDAPSGLQRLINSELPRAIAAEIETRSGRLIQISTDGVFSGKRGSYSESDTPDASDTYGAAKLAGEVCDEPHLTIRTSIIGPELNTSSGLVEWLRRTNEAVHGYKNVFWSGVTTLELAKFLSFAIERNLSGLLHLSSERISKYDLLIAINESYGLNKTILETDKPILDRSLITARNIGYTTPSIKIMLTELRAWELENAALYSPRG